jgi:glucose 1-dehydrogenase
MKLKDQCAIVTGAGQGIGAACVRRFVSEGAFVVMVDQDFGPAHSWLGNVQAQTRLITGSVTSQEAIDQALEAAALQGGPSILVNNAGITHAASFLDLEIADYDRVMDVNLRSYFRWGRGGNIINMSSVNAVLAIAEQVPYVISKGAVNQLTKVMALGLAPHNIRVNAIGPGTIATELAKQAVLGSEAARQKILSRTPLRRMGEPEEIASVAAFLASEDASYFTGQTLYPDGGRLALNYSVALE